MAHIRQLLRMIIMHNQVLVVVWLLVKLSLVLRNFFVASCIIIVAFHVLIKLSKNIDLFKILQISGAVWNSNLYIVPDLSRLSLLLS